MQPPEGVVTLLFTDVEGSTSLFERIGDRFADVLLTHRRLLREAFEQHSGYEVGTEGDSFFVAFSSADDAASAALRGQEALGAFDWPDGERVRVRMGIHTCEPRLEAGNYLGHGVNRAARVMSAAHGGQVLLTEEAKVSLTGDLPIQDLGVHRLKDISAPERLYQLTEEAFPSPRTLPASNLTLPTGQLFGRAGELAAIAELLVSDRLITLVGPGGIGKTRLAQHAAAAALDAFPDGVVWISLAPLREPNRVLPTILDALGAPNVESLRARAVTRLLVVIDNAEHVLDEAVDAILTLVSIGATVMTTTRERLNVPEERVVEVLPLETSDAVALFVARARQVSPGLDEHDVALRRLVERLDAMPLALELAAARTRVFTVSQLEERLGNRLDVLTAGRGVDARQQTLRATIEWSYDLLEPHEQDLLHALSVFAGGWTFEAAESVARADVDTFQSLLDKSLVRRLGDSAVVPRFTMLETIREFAAERRDSTAALLQRHAEWYAELSKRHVNGTEGDYVAWSTHLRAEHDNVVLALDTLRTAEEWSGFLAFVHAARFYPLYTWAPHLDAFERAFESDTSTGGARLELVSSLAMMRAIVGDLEIAAGRLRDSLPAARADPDATIFVRMAVRLMSVLIELEQLDEARELVDELATRADAAADPLAVGNALVSRASIEWPAGNYVEATRAATEALRYAGAVRDYDLGYAYLAIAFSSAELQDPATALPALEAAAEVFDRLSDLLSTAYVLHIAARLLVPVDASAARQALALAERARELDGQQLQVHEARFARRTLELVGAAPAAPPLEGDAVRARTLDVLAHLRQTVTPDA